MAIIGIDARSALKERRGIGTCTLKLIQNLAQIDYKNQYILYVDNDDIKGLFPGKKNFVVKKLFPTNYILWEQISLPLALMKDKVDIMHFAGITASLFLGKSVKTAATIHDVTFLKDYSFLPASNIFYQRIGRIYRKYIVSLTINRFDEIITITEFSKKDILGHFPGLDPEKIKVSYLAADSEFHIQDKEKAAALIKNNIGLEEDYLMLLGGVDPRKNTEFVIRSYFTMRKRGFPKAKLVIVGLPNWKKTNFYSLVERSVFRDDVVFTDHIGDEFLVALYNCALVFLYPSLFEGFGLPLLEAMACGCPVVASNTSCIPEVAGDAGVYIDPYSDEDFISGIKRILDDTDLRKRCVENGRERVKKFSWMKMTQEILGIYRKLGAA